MSILSFILVHLMMWLIVFFMSLPFGVKVSNKPKRGNANSAPIKTNLKLKFFISFIIAFIPSVFTYWIVAEGLLKKIVKNITIL
tara:strand:- start:49 stop:300 length:252 start_codon:yes stop_codon:yes gene_type:complete